MATYDQTAKHYANQREKQLRAELAKKYGTRKYRITSDNEVHAYGRMPNSVETGWYLVGSVREVERDLGIR